MRAAQFGLVFWVRAPPCVARSPVFPVPGVRASYSEVRAARFTCSWDVRNPILPCPRGAHVCLECAPPRLKRARLAGEILAYTVFLRHSLAPLFIVYFYFQRTRYASTVQFLRIRLLTLFTIINK